MKTLALCAIVAGVLGLAAAQAGACACSKQLCNLDAAQSALYLDCVMTMQGAQLPVSFDFNAIQALDQLSAERQSGLLTTCHGLTVHKLPALNGLSDVQLAILQEHILEVFARAEFPGKDLHKAEKNLLMSLSTMTNAQCVSTAAGSGL